jgi:uncharacterized membrane protein YfcA
VTGIDSLWLVLAGIGGGLAGSIAGLASIVSYPALLAVGLPPVMANVTNTVSLVFGSVGSISGSRPELRGQGHRARHLAWFAIAGGVSGGLLLLATPPQAFAKIVPWLIGLASLAILIRPDRTKLPPPVGQRPTWALSGGVFLVGVYGGYFGAAAGVILLALLLISTSEVLARSNALKNLLLGLANGIAALVFVFFGPVRWAAVLPLGLGLLIGGRIGPIVVRRAPAGPLRVRIACAGIGLAVSLAVRAYR